MEIGDRIESGLDLSYRRYREYISQHYGWQPAPQAVWIQVNRGIANNSRTGANIRLCSNVEHQKRKAERAREAASALQALSGA